LKENHNVKDFESACGVGITVSPEEIEHVVENLIKKHRDELLDKRYTEHYFRISSLQFTYCRYCICSCVS
jgi:Glutaminyl-tRNA synthetase, non-specific RNA binding region part 1.